MFAELDPALEPDTAGLVAILKAARSVAVLVAHDDAARPAHSVPMYLIEHGYQVFPVNGVKVGQHVLGEAVPAAQARLTDLKTPIDVVDVFRNSEAVAGHVDEILAMTPPPKVVWLQQGVRNDAAAQRLRAAGIVVVQDRCTLAEHRRAGLGQR
jgi:hypothetical protein